MHKFFEKLDVFNNIMFDERWHKYTIGGIPTISVTKVTGKVQPPFDALKQAPISVVKYNREHGTNISADDLRAIWALKNIISTEKGTAVHKYLESGMANKFEYYPVDRIKSVFTDSHLEDLFPMKPLAEVYGNITMGELCEREFVRNEFGNNIPAMIKRNYDKIIGHVGNFRKAIAGKMYPVKSEVVIGSPKYLVCGMVDQIFYNVKSGNFEIWDWKTNTDFETESRFYLAEPLAYIQKTNLDEYSLQLACYKIMFQEMTGIPIGDCYLCWFSEKSDNFKPFKCKEYEKEARLLLETYGMANQTNK